MLTTFFLTATAAITGIQRYAYDRRKLWFLHATSFNFCHGNDRNLPIRNEIYWSLYICYQPRENWQGFLFVGAWVGVIVLISQTYIGWNSQTVTDLQIVPYDNGTIPCLIFIVWNSTSKHYLYDIPKTLKITDDASMTRRKWPAVGQRSFSCKHATL